MDMYVQTLHVCLDFVMFCLKIYLYNTCRPIMAKMLYEYLWKKGSRDSSSYVIPLHGPILSPADNVSLLGDVMLFYATTTSRTKRVKRN